MQDRSHFRFADADSQRARKARHARVDIPTSKLKVEVARILKEEGYISTYKLVEENKTRKDAAPVPEIHAGQAAA